MKKIILLFSFYFLAICFSYAQQYEDIVYLKNGSIIHGTIIEQVPNVSVKIKTKDGNILVYKMEEIDKLTKEEIKVVKTEEEKSDTASTSKTSGFYWRADAHVGFPMGNDKYTKYISVSFGNNFHFGYIFSKFLIASANVGWNMWTTSSPLTENEYEAFWGGSILAGNFKPAGSFIYFARVGGGGQFNSTANIEGTEIGGNLVFGAGFGFKLGKSKSYCIILEPAYYLTLNDLLPCSMKISIGFMKIL